MLRTIIGGIGLALALGAAPALAQADWKVECAPEGGKGCVAKSAISYRAGAMMIAAPKTLTVSVRDDASRPMVSMQLADTEVRYAQFRLDQPVKTSDMVCDGVECAMSFADARATIDGMKAGRQAAILLFTNNGQVVQVRLSNGGFVDAVARTRAN